MKRFLALIKSWSSKTWRWAKDLPLWLKYAMVALIIAGIAALIIKYRGLREQIDTGLVGRTISNASEVDNLWFLPDGRLVGTLKQPDAKWVVSIWQEQNQTLISKLGTFDEKLFLSFLREEILSQRWSSEEMAVRFRLGTATPAVMRDGSKMVIYGYGYLAVFPNDWNRSVGGVQIVNLPVDANDRPLAITVTDSDRIALIYPYGRVELRDPNKLESALYTRTIQLSRPSLLKPMSNFLAAVSSQDAAVAMLDLNSVQEARLHGFPPTSSDQFKLAISPRGRLAIGTGADEVRLTPSSGLGDANIPVRAYGTVKTLSFFDENRVISGGDFQDVYLLAQDELPYKIAIAPSGVKALAVSASRLAYAGDDGIVLLWHTKRRLLNLSGKITIALFAAILLGLAAFYRYDYKQRLKEGDIQGDIPPVPLSEAGEAHLPLPEPPDALVKAFRAGECVLYGGSGVSAQAGFPPWQLFVEHLTRWAIDNEFVDTRFASSLRAALDQGQYDAVADNLVSLMRSREGRFNEYLREVFLKKTTLPTSINLLKSLPFSAVLTTNFDTLLEQAFDHQATAAFSPTDAEVLLRCLHNREFFLLKLYGMLDRPETVMIAPAQYDETVKGNLLFSQFMETLLFSRTLLFVGSSLEGIEAYLKGISLPRQNLRTHYALVAVTGEAWRTKANPLKERYGIEVLPYSPSPGHPQLQSFLENLNQKVKAEFGRTEDDVETGSVLKKVVLFDIGPFEHLELDFDPRWNILLGDNGVGKSSIIKAIATAILGEDSKSYAGRLIKSGKPNGAITMSTGRNVYTTKLFRKNGESRVESIPGRPFEAEGWLAVGFPPLRSVSWARPKGPETETKGRPTPDDLLPVVTGETDPRLDKLKQWIVNIDYWIKDAKSRERDPGQYQRLLKDFFDVVKTLTKGVNIEFKEVRPQTNEVIIKTDDGELPIEALSQGMTSLIGWVGILLQRMYEVYGADTDPKQRYALVLMDEIDAHLHPAWQQSLIRQLSEIFPNVQFIATTHSPLIVGGMRPEQVMRFARDEDQKVVVYKVEEEMTIGRADQILTSDLFGLQSTFSLNEELEVVMKEYHDLLAKDRDPKEEVRFQRLRESLKIRIPLESESPPERRAMALLEALLQEQTDGKYESVNQRTRLMAEKLLNEIGKNKK